MTLQFVFHAETADAPEEIRAAASAKRIGSVRLAMEQLDEAGIDYNVIKEIGDTTAKSSNA